MIANSKFCFQYCIQLQDGSFGSILINEKSDLYRQAEDFCSRHKLDSSVVPLLQNQIFQEVLRIKSASQEKENQQKKKDTHQIQSQQKSSKHRENNQSQMSNSQKLMSNLPQKHNQEKKKNQKSRKYFQQLYRYHELIQSKKKLQRKASLEKIPFKPQINNLSRKIVEKKRQNSRQVLQKCSQDVLTGIKVIINPGKSRSKNQLHESACKNDLKKMSRTSGVL